MGVARAFLTTPKIIMVEELKVGKDQLLQERGRLNKEAQQRLDEVIFDN